jgi:predicted GNAT family acetyltransferase
MRARAGGRAPLSKRMSMAADYTLIRNAAESRYEYRIDGHLAYVAYEEENDTVRLIRTFVPKALEGRGIAGTLVREVFDDIERRGMKMVPVCPYIIAYVEKHPEYRRLLAKPVRE